MIKDKKALHLHQYMDLAKHIESLLLDNDCVVIPCFGGFTARAEEALILEHSVFLPPKRVVSFNKQIQENDSLLAQSYIDAYDVSYPDALKLIQQNVDLLNEKLDREGEFVFNGVGTLFRNDEGYIEFEPNEAGILTPNLYALSSFELFPISSNVEEKEKLVANSHSNNTSNDFLDEGESNNDDFINEESSSSAKIMFLSSIKNLSIAAILILAVVILGSIKQDNNLSISSIKPTIFNSLDSNKAENTSKIQLNKTANIKSKSELKQKSKNVVHIEKPILKEKISKEREDIEIVDKPYCIVLASQTSKINAENYVGKLKKYGFSDGNIVKSSKGYRVVYGKFESENNAVNTLKSLRKQSKEFEQGWIMKK